MMAEATRYVFDHKEVVTALIKTQGLREGLWMLHLEFGLSATNIGPSDDNLVPAAIVGLIKIGLQRAEKPSNLSVDAGEVNPA